MKAPVMVALTLLIINLIIGFSTTMAAFNPDYNSWTDIWQIGEYETYTNDISDTIQKEVTSGTSGGESLQNEPPLLC